MTKIGPFDFTTMHVDFTPAGPALYERRLRRIIVNEQGQPLRAVTEGGGITSLLGQLRDGERIVRAWVLVPVNIASE